MKKALALILSVLFVMSVSFVLVSCRNGEAETTKATTTTETTTTTASETTTTTAATTTETTTTTTETTTTAETTTTTTETTTIPVFARFDFGTKTYAEDNSLTSHEYLIGALTYDKTHLMVTFGEDSWTISSLKDYSSGDSITSYALCFNDLLTFDFMDELKPGYSNHIYMRIRLKNDSKNNMIGLEFHNGTQDWSSTLVASNMYLQGGDNNKKASAVSKTWQTYTYDMTLCSGLASGKARAGITSWSAFVADVKANGTGNNWIWQGDNSIIGLRFHLLGAYASKNAAACDSRSNITITSTVEVDYILFGHAPEQLDTYHSYIESSSLAAN